MDSVTYVIVFNVRPGQRDEFLRLLGGVLDAMRVEKTLIGAILHSDPEREHRFMLYETWASHQDVVEVQLQRPYRRQWHEALPRLLEGEREITIWNAVRR